MSRLNTLTFILLILIVPSCGNYQSGTNKKIWVRDLENILTDKQELSLDSIISDFEKRTHNEILIVTIRDIDSTRNVVDFAAELGKKWGVGKKEKNNGLVILFSKTSRKTALATGYGTEEFLKDEICKKIIDSVMIPYFKQENYFEGIKAGLKESIIKWE